jgi:hypothetical protein
LLIHPSDGLLQQKAAYEPQVEPICLSVAQTKGKLAESMKKGLDTQKQQQWNFQN